MCTTSLPENVRGSREDVQRLPPRRRSQRLTRRGRRPAHARRWRPAPRRREHHRSPGPAVHRVRGHHAGREAHGRRRRLRGEHLRAGTARRDKFATMQRRPAARTREQRRRVAVQRVTRSHIRVPRAIVLAVLVAVVVLLAPLLLRSGSGAWEATNIRWTTGSTSSSVITARLSSGMVLRDKHTGGVASPCLYGKYARAATLIGTRTLSCVKNASQ